VIDGVGSGFLIGALGALLVASPVLGALRIRHEETERRLARRRLKRSLARYRNLKEE
jgi:hypothetical protein